MIAPTYVRLEVARTARNRRFLVFSLVFPLVLYFAIAGTNRHQRVDGTAFPLYYMAGMAAWGTMNAVIAGGARIAAERSVGWTRQMRVTPLRTHVYFETKVLCGYLMAIVSMVALYLAGSSLGVRLSASEWLVMTGLLLVGLVPFAALSVLLGHLLTVDSMGPALGGTTSFLALIGGTFGPLATHGALYQATRLFPSYWLVQAGRTALGGHSWPAEGWVVIAAWTVLLGSAAVVAYRRDTQRL